ncbi:MAG: cytidylate kinase-like family protein [Anaerolineae bacterium]|jgi:cytidylate kinase
MVVITVSRQRGSMGSYIALEVAQRLGLRYLDREILESVAREAGVSIQEVEDIEARAGRLARVLHALGAKPKLPSVASASLREQESYEARVSDLMEVEGLNRHAAVMRLSTTGGLEYVPRLDYLDLITSIITEYAAQGQAMIVGRGGQMILRGDPNVLHIQVRARFETRVYNIMQREEVKWRPAAHRVRRSDEQRAGYLRRFYNVDWLDPSLYDLVINTDHIPLAAATEMIILAAQTLSEAEDEG